MRIGHNAGGLCLEKTGHVSHASYCQSPVPISSSQRSKHPD